MSLIIRRIYRNDVATLKLLFNRTPFLSEFNPFRDGSEIEFLWQFFSKDYFEAIYYIAYDDDDMILIGTLAALIIPMKTLDGKVCYTLKPEDALINVSKLVKYNIRDIFNEMFDNILHESSSKDVAFSWGFTEAVDAFKRLGFKNCFNSKQGVYIFKPFLAYKHLLQLNKSNRFKQKSQILLLSMVSKLYTYLYSTSESGIKSEEINFKDIDEEILLSFLPQNLYSLYLNKYFITWRILKNPSELSYKILRFTNHQGSIIAYFIYSVKHRNVYFIEQMLFNRSLNCKQKQKIIYSVLRQLKKNGAVIIRAMGFDHNSNNKEEIDILSRIGFVFVKKGIPFIIRSNIEIVNPNEIYLSRLNTQGTF